MYSFKRGHNTHYQNFQVNLKEIILKLWSFDAIYKPFYLLKIYENILMYTRCCISNVTWYYFFSKRNISIIFLLIDRSQRIGQPSSSTWRLSRSQSESKTTKSPHYWQTKFCKSIRRCSGSSEGPTFRTKCWQFRFLPRSL